MLSSLLWLSAAVLLYLASIDPVGKVLLAPLEYRYAPLDEGHSPPQVSFIVVLGNGYWPRDEVPITAALSQDGLARIAEGVRLWRQAPGARLVVSGGAAEGHPATAIGYARFASAMGVDAAAIIKLEQPLDTAEEARAVAALLGATPFLLVTSAYHMPRAMHLMTLAGAHPIAAPTGQLTSQEWRIHARAWVPNSTALRQTECAIHEYVGLALAQ